jgi:hypothetical protein
MFDRLRKIDAPFSSFLPRLTSYSLALSAILAFITALWHKVALAQLSPTERDIELIRNEGFETYAAWIMLTVVLGLLAFVIRRFGKLIDNERDDRNAILKSLVDNIVGCNASLVLVQKEIVEQRRDATVQRSRLETQIRESKDYYAEALGRILDKQGEIDRRLEALERIGAAAQNYITDTKPRIESIESIAEKLDPARQSDSTTKPAGVV